jgi:hypothetical protein
MAVRGTSRSAYQEHVVSGKAVTQRERILECLRDAATPLNRRQIHKLTGIPINAVAGRVNALMEEKAGNHALVRKVYDGRDPVTGAPCEYLEAVHRTFKLDEETGQWTFELGGKA